MPCLPDSHEGWEKGISLTLSWKKQVTSSGRIYPASFSVHPSVFLLEDLVRACCLTSHCPSCVYLTLSSLCASLDEVLRVTLNTVSFSAKNVDTTMLSHSKVGKYRPMTSHTHTHTPNFTFSPNWTHRITTGTHADTDVFHPSDRFTGSSRDE